MDAARPGQTKAGEGAENVRPMLKRNTLPVPVINRCPEAGGHQARSQCLLQQQL
jgi:hypothetical protein